MAERNGYTAHMPLVISTIVVLLTIMGGFWSLADPRSELKNIRENYLTIREHQEFQNRVTRDILRLESENQLQASKAELEAIVKERRTELDAIHKELAHIMDLIHQHERDDTKFKQNLNANKNGR